MNIAVFGGSFDPFHIGHEKIIKLSLEKLDIEKLLVIPTYLNPFKNTSKIEANIRLEIVKYLYENNSNVNIVDYEVKKNKKISTYETIQYIKSIYNLSTIYLIIGADNLKNIQLWYNFTKLEKLVTFVIINRNNLAINCTFKNAILLNFDEDISSSKLRNNMELKYIPLKIQNRIKKLWKIE